jgi:hypothetical protein
VIITRIGETGKAAGCPRCRCRTWVFDFAFSGSSYRRPHRSRRPIAIHPSIFPIPCLLLNLSVLACYPLPCLFTLSLEVPSSSPDLFPPPAVHSLFALFTLSPKSIWELFCNQQDPHSFLTQPGVRGFFPFWNGATEKGGAQESAREWLPADC